MFLLAGILAGCNDPYKEQLFKAYDESPVALLLSENPDYSMWVEMWRRVDLYNAMNLGTGTYTCFVADNNAVSAYLQEHGYSSIDSIGYEDLEYLMRYHVINGSKIAYSSLLLKLSLPALSGDYLTAGIDIETEERYIENGEGCEPSFVVKKDIQAKNGVIHVLNRVLEPITASLWSLIKGNIDYSIFAKAISETGIDEYLDNTYLDVLDVKVRENKTVLVVPDAVFHSHGIGDYDALKEYFGTSDASDITSGLYRYIEYHVMDSMKGYADLTTFPSGYRSMTVYNRSSIRGYSVLDTLGTIIFNPQSGEKSFRISSTRKDIPAKNGYIHEIDNLGLIPQQMAHYIVEWEPTDRIEFSAIPFYRSSKIAGESAEEYELISSGLEIPGIRYESVPESKAQIWYHSEYLGNGRYLYNDALYWNMGNIGWIEFDIPVLPVGKYRLEAEKSNNATNGGKSFIYWDGDEASLAGNSEINFVNGVTHPEWTTRSIAREEAHTVKFVVGSTGGICGIDRLVFVPVE